MRRLSRRFGDSSRTTDVLSFRLADKTIASRLARRNPVKMSWEKVTSSLPPAKYMNLDTIRNTPPEELAKYIAKCRAYYFKDDPDLPERDFPRQESFMQESLKQEPPKQKPPAQPNEVGTIALAVDYCHRVARKRNIPLEYYLMLATTHGMAHLVGFVHNSDKDYLDMKRAEEEAIEAVKIQVGFGNIEEQNARASAPVNLPTSYLS